MRYIATVVAVAAAGGLALSPASAQRGSMEKASSLGSVLGSEKACGLKFDQKAIEIWIEKNVKADDMEFAGMLNLMTAGTAQEIKEMSAAQKAAHCTQIRRVAKANRFIAD